MAYCIIKSDAIVDETLSLQHYGILGMKWGIRRTPEQLGHHRIKKGTIMYRVTSDPNESHTGYAYVSYLKPDRDRYRAWQLSDSRQKYEKKYALTKDLNIPSRAELTDVIYQIIQTDIDKKYLKEVSDVVYNKIYGRDDWMDVFGQSDGIGKKPSIDRFMKGVLKESPEELMVDVMDALNETANTRSAIFDELKRRGYNAIVDEHDVGGTLSWSKRAGVEPLIVFDRQDSLSEINATLVSEKAAKRSSQRYRRWQETVERHKDQQW